MSKNKNKNLYGTFVTKRPWYLRRKFIAVAGISAAVLILAVVFWRNDKKQEQTSLLNIPQAVASDMPGWWLKDYFGSSVCESVDYCGPDADPDRDKLSNAQEFYYHSDPLEQDTNSNGLTDGEDISYNYDPSKSGKVTFDELMTDESLLGESLVFDQDVKQMVAEANDIDKVTLPLPEDEELHVLNTQDPATYRAYAFGLSETINKYFPQKDLPGIKDLLKSGSDFEVRDIKLKSEMLARELKDLPVPAQLLMFHKYNVALFQLLPQVILPPADIFGPAGDLWYDRAQAFLAVQQRLDFEYQGIQLSSR